MSSLISRRRNAPWIHRWSRQIIGAIALLGAANTGYLTITKLTQTSALCPTSGCERVLESPYATIFGLPLALFGLLAYLAMAVFSLGPLLLKGDQNRSLRKSLEKPTWWLILAGATSMTVFSGYLMYIMFSQFVSQFGAGGLCYFCLFSALFALSMLVVTLIGKDWEDIGQLFFIGVIVAIATLVVTLALYAPISGKQPIAADKSIQVSNTSSPAEIELAKHLKNSGAKMYGAYWCGHCHTQKELFGKEAVAELPYVECDPDGKNSQPELCAEVAQKSQQQTGQPFGYPTWQVNGQFYSGTQSLTDLARVSGYKGPQNFKNGV